MKNINWMSILTVFFWIVTAPALAIGYSAVAVALFFVGKVIWWYYF